ncbi:MAG: hypothetical protein JW953_13255 [Anaerolineae bacterium]|nr:hypothetical protein [Anaerolineae bacterium]
MISKKKSERDIFNLVYEESDWAEIISSERPDFKIRNSNFDIYFGVEVTEFYFSESNARIRNIPNYVNEIINQNTYRHKEDQVTLKVNKIQITSADGTPKGDALAILQELPRPEQYANMVAEVIALKDEKFKEYAQDLTHINLIVLDTERRLRTVTADDFYKNFVTLPLKNTLYSTKFREVFLVTILEENRKVYIPLKMLLLLAEFFMFGKIVLEYPWETIADSSFEQVRQETRPAKIMMIFAKYLKVKTNEVYFHDEAGQLEVIFGNSGLVFDEGKLALNDHNDYSLPFNTKKVRKNQLTTFFSSSKFQEVERHIFEEYTFHTEIAFDVKGDIEF